MHKEIFINVTQHEKRVAVLIDKRIEEFYTERLDDINLVGNIYKGRVESVLPGMGAAFVDIGLEKNGFLYVADVVPGMGSYEKLLEEGVDEELMKKAERQRNLPPINQLLKKGDEVLVQIVKEPISTKGARLTTHISIPGRFLVMMPFDNHIGLSKRIESREERDRIRKILGSLKLPKDIGFIVRTAAQGASEKDFQRESRYLLNLWQQIKAKTRRSKTPALIHAEYDLILRVVRDIFTVEFNKMEVDSRDDFKRVSRFLNILAPHLRQRTRLHTDKVALFEKHDIEKQIEKIYDRVVQLKSGGYLIFDQTESLVAIDVNSGKFVGKKNLEDTAFKTNLEAANEVPRQLKLRDLGGIIIIDFIDMDYADHRKSVFKTLERRLEDDKAKTNILSISSIGLVEMTRQRVRESIESKSYQKCPYCNGRGIVKSISTVSIELIRKLEHVLQNARSREVFVSMHPEVAYYVSSPEKNMIKPLERRFRKNIRIIEDPNIHIEEIKIEERNA
ncbi:MAG: Rne/Rng family ribonuclease [Candidatus Omnitrophica bacterium]|nr:Rne/Rng family ribonuclease [Candidatus Omnitrophota bacterium]